MNPYLKDEHLMNLRANSFQQGDDDRDQVTVQDLAPQDSQGKCKFKHQFSGHSPSIALVKL